MPVSRCGPVTFNCLNLRFLRSLAGVNMKQARGVDCVSQWVNEIQIQWITSALSLSPHAVVLKGQQTAGSDNAFSFLFFSRLSKSIRLNMSAGKENIGDK